MPRAASIALGLLLLLGIAKKNSIILVDYAVQGQHERGLSAHEAMLNAGPVRLRPILMTTMATMCAAIPPPWPSAPELKRAAQWPSRSSAAW